MWESLITWAMSPAVVVVTTLLYSTLFAGVKVLQTSLCKDEILFNFFPESVNFITLNFYNNPYHTACPSSLNPKPYKLYRTSLCKDEIFINFFPESKIFITMNL
jgi:hypothetical protein